MKTRITSHKSLVEEKNRLRAQKAEHETALRKDVDFIKKEYLSSEIINKVAASMVPDYIRHSKILNTPINFISKFFSKNKEEVVSNKSDSGKGNRVRNIALAVAESALPSVIKMFLRRKK